mmetsp:Transcript_16694/g.27450  ORF Transcript_16694/g.27450 Transcript_16694/m.27450 type:complete len:319 (+) Transcript_16694:157-1113(+)
MSANSIDEAATNEVCASCGIAAGSDIKLRKCTACKNVKYCSVECQKNHRPKHKKACKKRAAELRDEILFKQPESTHEGECPICCIPHSLDVSKGTMMPCCSKTICNGCYFAMGYHTQCPYCRLPVPGTVAETGGETLIQQYRKKRLEANDDIAIRQLGTQLLGKGDYIGACEQWKKAAEMGNSRAHYELAVMYGRGRGVEEDSEKEKYHLEEAAIAGLPTARLFLGVWELTENSRVERAVAVIGSDGSISLLKDAYKTRFVIKEDFAAAVRAHQAAVYATKRSEREAVSSAMKLIKETFDACQRKLQEDVPNTTNRNL